MPAEVVRSRKGSPITAHGFRATFRTWAEEVATFPHAVVEQAMGHRVGGKSSAPTAGRMCWSSGATDGRMGSYCEPREAGKVVTFKKNAAISV